MGVAVMVAPFFDGRLFCEEVSPLLRPEVFLQVPSSCVGRDDEAATRGIRGKMGGKNVVTNMFCATCRPSFPFFVLLRHPSFRRRRSEATEPPTNTHKAVAAEPHDVEATPLS